MARHQQRQRQSRQEEQAGQQARLDDQGKTRQAGADHREATGPAAAHQAVAGQQRSKPGKSQEADDAAHLRQGLPGRQDEVGQDGQHRDGQDLENEARSKGRVVAGRQGLARRGGCDRHGFLHGLHPAAPVFSRHTAFVAARWAPRAEIVQGPTAPFPRSRGKRSTTALATAARAALRRSAAAIVPVR